jgi:hypothetical protein
MRSVVQLEEEGGMDRMLKLKARRCAMTKISQKPHTRRAVGTQSSFGVSRGPHSSRVGGRC